MMPPTLWPTTRSGIPRRRASAPACARTERASASSVAKSVCVHAEPVRYDAVYSIPIEKPTFLIVVVRGDVPLPNVARDTTLPFAFTNPIWIEP